MGLQDLWIDSVDILLENARRLYKEIEYERSLGVVSEIMRRPGLSKEEEALAYFLQGACFTGLGHASKAVQAFMKVLKFDPGLRLSEDTLPSVKAMFNLALKHTQEGKGPEIFDLSEPVKHIIQNNL